MKKAIKILCFLYLSVFLSCKNGVNIEITNKSKIDVKKIVIKTGFSNHDLDSLKINETKNIFLDFSKNKIKHDGIMGLYIYKNNNIKSKDYKFGYYSNGIPPNDIKITIKDDTVLFKRNEN